MKQHATGTSKYELRLGPGRDGVSQTITGLFPDTSYTLSARARISNKNEMLVLGVRGHGAPLAEVSLASPDWERMNIQFKTGPQAREATIFMRKSSDGDGFAWCDNLTLPLNPK